MLYLIPYRRFCFRVKGNKWTLDKLNVEKKLVIILFAVYKALKPFYAIKNIGAFVRFSTSHIPY